MSVQLRALLIGMIGPALQAAGVAWDLLEHGVFARSEIGHLTFEHIISGPAHLLMATGFAVSVVCIPLALQVVTERPDELERRGADEAAISRESAFGAAEAQE